MAKKKTAKKAIQKKKTVRGAKAAAGRTPGGASSGAGISRRKPAGGVKKASAKREKPGKSGGGSVKEPKTAKAARAGGAAKVMKPAPVEREPAHEFAVEAARLLADDRCTDVVLLDVRNLSQVTDFIVVGSGTSDRQMRSVLEHVEELGVGRGFAPWKRDTDTGGLWLLLDCVDVVVHLFEPNTRAHYDLEMMWGDAPRLEWQRPDQATRDRAGLGATR